MDLVLLYEISPSVAFIFRPPFPSCTIALVSNRAHPILASSLHQPHESTAELTSSTCNHFITPQIPAAKVPTVKAVAIPNAFAA